MPTFAEKIKTLRLRRGWSQRALTRELNARGVEVSQRAVSGWETGAAPRPEMVAACAALFSLPVELLRDEKRELPPEPAQLAGVLRELPPRERELVTTGALAWRHYLDMESLLDTALRTRAPLPDAEEEKDFQAMLRAFMTQRERGRAAVIRARDMVDGISELIFRREKVRKKGGPQLTRAEEKAIEIAEAELKRRREADQSSEASAQFGAGS